jgi:hypothetical protein
MKRYIILFNTGQLVQQRGLNMTYLQLHDLGIIKLIIDTTTGEYLTAEKWVWKKIQEYDDSTLVEKDLNRPNSK